MKEFTVTADNGNVPTVVFQVEEAFTTEAAEYFRLLSANYHDFVRGVMPWPARPEGLVRYDPEEETE